MLNSYWILRTLVDLSRINTQKINLYVIKKIEFFELDLKGDWRGGLGEEIGGDIGFKSIENIEI